MQHRRGNPWPLVLFMVVVATRVAVGGDQHAQAVHAPHVTVSLVSEVMHVQPGTAFEVGVRFEPEPGWHVYWRNPGDSGVEPRVEWRLPPGFAVSALRWPAPHRIPVGPLVNFGYEGQVMLLAEVTPAADLTVGDSVVLAADVEWLVCADECVAVSAGLTVELPVAAAAATDPQARDLFEQTRTRLPLSADQLGWRASARLSADDLLELTLTPTGRPPAPVRHVEFFPAQVGFIEHAAAQTLRTRPGGTLVLSIPLEPGGDRPRRVDGVLVNEDGWRGSGEAPAMSVDVPCAGALEPVEAPDRSG